MSQIRKQTITSSIIAYIGILIGAFNTYFFVRNGSFTPAQFGLTRMFFDVGQNIIAFGSLGVLPVLYKFYPYYKDNLPDTQNDLFGRVILNAATGFALVVLAGIVFEPYVVRKFSENSPLFIQYYHFVYIFGLGMLLFSAFENYCWAIQKTIISNALKDTGLRALTTVFILLFYFKVIEFSQFVELFSLLYLIITSALILYLKTTGQLHIVFKRSRVTEKFRKKMMGLQVYVFGGIILQALAITVSSFIIASLKGLGSTGIYNLAAYTANLVEIPQRNVVSIATGVLSRAWKDKNMPEIQRIYQRSSINMLLLALFIFGNMWLNINQGFQVLNIQAEFMQGIAVIFVLGIAKIIDAGTGVNATIIGTSTLWKFEFITGVILLVLRIPLVYLFIKEYGLVGSACAELISQVIYNFIRYEFIRRKYGMQPFSMKTIYSILLAVGSYFLIYFLLNNMEGWAGIFIRSALFSGIMIAGIFFLNLTPDARQLYDKFILRKK